MRKWICCTMILCCGLAQAQTFQDTYGGTGSDYMRKVLVTASGEIIMAGTTNSIGNQAMQHLYIVKTDPLGHMLWNKIYEAEHNVNLDFCSQSADGGFIVAGSIGSTPAPDGYDPVDAFFAKLDAEGNVLWTKRYTGQDREGISQVLELDNGGYMVTGSTKSFNSNPDAFIIQTDASRNTVWCKTYESNLEDSIASLIADGNNFITAGTKWAGQNDGDMLVSKIDFSGGIIWSKIYIADANAYSTATNVIKVSDSRYVIAANSGTSTQTNPLLFKIDGSGNVDWNKKYTVNALLSAADIIHLPNGDYALVGNILDASDNADFNVYSLRTDANGEPVWSKSYGGTDNEFGVSLINTTDNGLLLGCRSTSFGDNSLDFYLLKTDNLGNSGCSTQDITTTMSPALIQSEDQPVNVNVISFTEDTLSFTIESACTVNEICNGLGIEQEQQDALQLLVYPNPAHDAIAVSLGNSQIDTLIIYNSIGQKVYASQNVGSVATEISVSELPTGIYYLKITSSGKSYYRKFIRD